MITENDSVESPNVQAKVPTGKARKRPLKNSKGGISSLLGKGRGIIRLPTSLPVALLRLRLLTYHLYTGKQVKLGQAGVATWQTVYGGKRRQKAEDRQITLVSSPVKLMSLKAGEARKGPKDEPALFETGASGWREQGVHHILEERGSPPFCAVAVHLCLLCPHSTHHTYHEVTATAAFAVPCRCPPGRALAP